MHREGRCVLDDAELESLIADASALGLVLAAKRSELSVHEKVAGDFASQADEEVERLIRRGLAERGDKAAILGEEGGGSLGSEETGWVLDPIDGTGNFLRGLPLWGISIGYLERGVPLLGAIALPELGVTLTARRGQGVRIGGRPMTAVGTGPVRLFALGENEFEPGAETDRRAETLRTQGYGVVRYRCAVFALANVALGRLDGYVEHGCCLWDVAAAWVICAEAGADVSVRQIAPGRYAVDARWGDRAV